MKGINTGSVLVVIRQIGLNCSAKFEHIAPLVLVNHFVFRLLRRTQEGKQFVNPVSNLDSLGSPIGGDEPGDAVLVRRVGSAGLHNSSKLVMSVQASDLRCEGSLHACYDRMTPTSQHSRSQ